MTCTACGHARVDREPFRHDWNGRTFWVHRCRDCTHQFLRPAFTAADLAVLYGDDYFANGVWAEGFFADRYEDSEPQLREEAREILSLLPGTGSLLDVGCAGGTFLDQARAHGHCPVYGIELNQRMADHAVSHYGLSVIRAPVEEIPGDQWTDLGNVTILDTLEHLNEPLAVLRKVSGWLRPGGYVLIRGPMSNGWTSKVKEAVRRTLRIEKRLDCVPKDVNFWNRRSLATSLREAGLEPVRWWARDDFGNVLAVKP